ncbi:MAG: DUF1232 domain-containing protein [Armatimonadetes bacterium]|nr:DUF1232 domain-containing protein [Armatimonadota bacterium]
MAVEASELSDGLIAKVVEKLRGKAEECLRNPERIKELLGNARDKVKDKADDRGPLTEVWSYLTSLVRLLQAYHRREYTDLPRSSIVAVTIAVIYFVAPLDLIPDFIPVAGWVDDAAVIGFVARQIKGDIDKFTAWEAERGPASDQSIA